MNRLFSFASSIALSSVLVVSASGCFPSLEKDPDFPKYFTKRLPRTTFQARLDGERLHGVDIEVKKDGNTYRGRSFVGTIDLRSDGEKIEGDMGSGRTELHVDAIPGGITAKGMISGAISDFDITETRFKGTIGPCNYDMGRNAQTGVWYEGASNCNGIGGETSIALPENFAQLPPDEQAVMLAVFLGH